MKQGTGRGVLVVNLLGGDGPYVSFADDFVVGRCSSCAVAVLSDAQFHRCGFLCPLCWGRQVST